MSDDEVFVLWGSIIAALILWGRWYITIISLHPFYKSSPAKLILSIVPLICGVALLFLLRTYASYDVVNSPKYITLYLFFGFAWVAVCLSFLKFLNIYWRDDVLERRNASALVVVTAAIIGSTICYGGANIGDGPGWWCVLVAGGLATISWFLSWLILEITCSLSEKITIDRDTTVGIRTAGYLIGSSLIFSRGAAGDWTSLPKTIIEFSAAWPALILLAAAIIIESKFYSKNENISTESTAFTIAIFYILFSLGAVVSSPDLPNNPDYPPAYQSE